MGRACSRNSIYSTMKRPFLLRSASLRSFPRLASSLHRLRRLVFRPDLCDDIAQIRFSIKPLTPYPTCGLPHAHPLNSAPRSIFRWHRKFFQSYAPYPVTTINSTFFFSTVFPLILYHPCGLPHGVVNVSRP